MPPAVALIRLLLSLLFITAISADQNVTVDDTFGDPITGEQFVYKPASGGSIPAWNVGQDCPGCFAQPDPDQTYLHTWHDGTTGIMTPMSASINFEGTALYVYCILVHSAVDSYFTTNTNLSFSIDGEVVGSFLDNSPVPAGSNSTYNYNVLVYSIDNLPHAQHSFTLTNGNLSLALLDKVVYTQQEVPGTSSAVTPTSPSSSSSSRTPSNTPSSSAVGITSLNSTPAPSANSSANITLSDTTFSVRTSTDVMGGTSANAITDPPSTSVSVTFSTGATPSAGDANPATNTDTPAASHSGQARNSHMETIIITAVAASAGGVLILLVAAVCFWRKRRRSRSFIQLLASNIGETDTYGPGTPAETDTMREIGMEEDTFSVLTSPPAYEDVARGIPQAAPRPSSMSKSSSSPVSEQMRALPVAPSMDISLASMLEGHQDISRLQSTLPPNLPTQDFAQVLQMQPGNSNAHFPTSYAVPLQSTLDSITSPSPMASAAPIYSHSCTEAAGDRKSIVTQASTLTMITIPAFLDPVLDELPPLPARADSVKTLGDRRTGKGHSVSSGSMSGTSLPSVDVTELPVHQRRNEFRDSATSKSRFSGIMGPRPPPSSWMGASN